MSGEQVKAFLQALRRSIVVQLSRQKSGQDLMSLIFQIILSCDLCRQGGIIILRRGLIIKG
jgi:hypothetical protein